MFSQDADYWEIQVVAHAHGRSVTIAADGVSFEGSAVQGLREGDVIAIRRTPSFGCFGAVHRCVLLSRAGWRAGEQGASTGEAL